MTRFETRVGTLCGSISGYPQSGQTITSKLPAFRPKNEFYRYYAGYSLDFAVWAIGKLDLGRGAVLMDPWSGSATTAAACVHAGLSCRAYDINPVMLHLGRARVSSPEHFSEAEELIDRLEAKFIKLRFTNLSTVGTAFREIPCENMVARSVAMAALFPLARAELGAKRTKNPSWFKVDSAFGASTFTSHEFFLEWRRLLVKLSHWRITQDHDTGAASSIAIRDSRKSFGRREAFDGLLTSPPYMTRLDYVQATLPEHLLLQHFDSAPDVKKLRRSMLGSPLTTARPEKVIAKLPPNIQETLAQIRSHPSKASSTYYHRFFSTYFVDLQTSMRNIAMALKRGAPGCIVVQSSHYKEIEIDLAGAVISIGEAQGLKGWRTTEFKATRSISEINTRAHKNAQRPKNEYALFFRKE